MCAVDFDLIRSVLFGCGVGVGLGLGLGSGFGCECGCVMGLFRLWCCV